MSWDDHNRRRTAIKSVLDYADKNPSAELPFDRVPDVAQIFADRHELLLALQYDWSQALWARIELLSLDCGRSGALTDADELARTAWAECAAKHPALRRLLDEHRDELGSTIAREQEIMVAAQIVA
jgi:hypothetical protein